MNYPIEQLEKDIAKIVADLAELRRMKGHDYSGITDTLDNLREFGSRGVLVRIGDKFKRLKHCLWTNTTPQISNETLEDSMQDLINYSLYMLILYRKEQENNEQS